MKKCNREHGVTLIALAVTIIVLVIICGISIGNLRSKNNIVNKASESQIQKDASEEKEAVEWAVAQMIGDENNLSGRISQKEEDKNMLTQKLKEYIGANAQNGAKFEFIVLGKGETDSTENEKKVTNRQLIVSFVVSGNRYIVDQNGNVYSNDDLSN